MKRKFRIVISIIVSTAIMVFLVTSVNLYSTVTENTNLSVPDTAYSPKSANIQDADMPVQLLIPTLDVDAEIQSVGVTEAGAMANPSGFDNVGWYKYGTVPGFRGSAVIGGHVDNALSLDGVFKHLHELNAGDDVYVMTQGGEKLHFKVTEIASYLYDEAPAEAIFSTNDRARLNLITCAGIWSKALKTYDRRLVVYTELVGIE